MEIINKDILTVKRGVIFQQVNCMGVMGSGIAKAIRDKWPQVFEEYKKFCSCLPKDGAGNFFRFPLLGELVMTKVGDELYVCSIFSQYDYNRSGEVFKKHTEYGAFNLGLKQARGLVSMHVDLFKKKELPVYFPYGIGANRGGGDFKIIEKIVEFHFPDAIFCKLYE